MAERFLGMPQDQFHGLIFQTLEGHLRAILGTLTVEEINNDRQSFAMKLTTEAAGDLEKMGIGLDALTMAYNAVQKGAAGVDMGRNIFQSDSFWLIIFSPTFKHLNQK